MEIGRKAMEMGVLAAVAAATAFGLHMALGEAVYPPADGPGPEAPSSGPVVAPGVELRLDGEGETLAPEPEPSPDRVAAAPPPARARHGEEFDRHLAEFEGTTADEFFRIVPPRDYLDRPGFDPASAEFFDEMSGQMKLTDEELETFSRNGFVGVDHGQPYSFNSAYFAIYTRDLPVLITTDSILHALHRTYDSVLEDLELSIFFPVLEEVLRSAHEGLVEEAESLDGETRARLADSFADVDVYLTVARKLLRGHAGSNPNVPGSAEDSELLRADETRRLLGLPEMAPPPTSQFGSGEKVDELLDHVRFLRLQFPGRTGSTRLFGDERHIDYSQFKPRGHYAKSAALRSYFRTMMWLSRADTGFVIAKPGPQGMMEADPDRELRSAALLVQAAARAGVLDPLESVNQVITYLVGESDNLQSLGLLGALGGAAMSGAGDLADPGAITRLREVIARGGGGAQAVRSQVLMSAPDRPEPVEPPELFQLFGQRFTIDGFVLSKLVFDSIIDDGGKTDRMMPTGADVAVALGNDHAAPLLRQEIERFEYGDNLLAARAFVDGKPDRFWDDTFYSGWIAAIRTLHGDLSAGRAYPDIMRTRPWQMKQLQAQLASWAELRHDSILYAKPSYSAGFLCEYPSGYVEPYPKFYRRVGDMVASASRRLTEIKLDELSTYWPEPDPEVPEGERRPSPGETLVMFTQRFADHFSQFATVMRDLERLAEKELNSEPFTEEETAFLKKTIDKRGGGSGGPRYDGWYSKLYYERIMDQKSDWMQFKPTVADVHTDPAGGAVLEVGVGSANFLVAAIDNAGDKRVYVGPVYSYYEFHRPAGQRMTDEEWAEQLEAGDEPDRPAWVRSFQAEKFERELQEAER